MDTWPTSLPQEFEVGNFSIDPGDNLILSEVEAGYPKSRKRFTKSLQTIEGVMDMTLDQVNTLETFINSTIGGGTEQFYFPRPGYCSGTIVVKLKGLPGKQHKGGSIFTITLKLLTLDDYIYAAP